LYAIGLFLFWLGSLIDCGYGFGIQQEKPGGLPGFKKGEQIVESRNSGDYMDAGGIVKARRRRITFMNTLMGPVKTPLFPTGELPRRMVCHSRKQLFLWD